jgi:coenzyme F420-reducing hydrogenase beta subunit
MINIIDKSSCSGCTACAVACPHSAIKMEVDEKGFVYPRVNLDLCVDCSICERVCPFHEQYERYDNYAEPRYYAMRYLDSEQLLKSQSGGAFYVLSNEILKRGGVVYGAGFDSAFRVEHQRTDSVEGRDKMRGSKYVQSALKDIFQIVKTDIRQGREVLFCGTPCQIAGLRAFFGRRQPESLITVDLLCHGVASPLFWHDYLDMIEKKERRKLTGVHMRDKSYGWLSSEETYVFGNKRVHKNTFYSLYYSGYISRESCFNCPFTNDKRVADLSLGDYHGWNNSHDNFTDNTGMSLVLVNSSKGQALIDSVKTDTKVYCTEQTVNPKDHVALAAVAHKADRYDAFWADFERKGAIYVCKKYGDMSFMTQLHIKLAKLLRHE